VSLSTHNEALEVEVDFGFCCLAALRPVSSNVFPRTRVARWTRSLAFEQRGKSCSGAFGLVLFSASAPLLTPFFDILRQYYVAADRDAAHDSLKKAMDQCFPFILFLPHDLSLILSSFLLSQQHEQHLGHRRRSRRRQAGGGSSRAV
jgi:hypothetical protein